MNRIEAMFAEKAKTGQKAFIPFITAGFPDLPRTERIITLLAENGADLIELGIPFSDPIADGPTIQRASAAALEAGASVARIVGLVRQVRRQTGVPILLFSAYNPLFHRGLARVADEAKQAGADGFLVPDLPPEESAEFDAILRERDMPLIYLVAPTTPPQRREKIARLARGFLYYISLKGVTGERASLPADLESGVAELRRHTALPIAVGFGISRPEHARAVARFADGVVVGSAIVKKIEELRDDPDWEHHLAEFVSSLASAAKASVGVEPDPPRVGCDFRNHA
ncbi:MAG: tryptophan synthase subunit alpha [Candidatus Sumerlaeia bacterium]|nr:tryptophan synthase subunit alpha [Candidatus Sumerlaeia bacterium]